MREKETQQEIMGNQKPNVKTWSGELQAVETRSVILVIVLW